MNKKSLAIFLSRANTLLTVIIVLACGYIVALPFIASLNVTVKKLQDTSGGYVYQTRLASSAQIAKENLKDIPKDNRLVIPKIFVDGPISEGATKEALNNGYWLRTPSVTPLSEDNFVIAGHRNIWKWTLYDLDKLTKGDVITIYWEGVEYNYRVEKTFEVDPTSVEIEASTGEKELTIYTCTPVLTAAKRLVVVAKPLIQ